LLFGTQKFFRAFSKLFFWRITGWIAAGCPCFKRQSSGEPLERPGYVTFVTFYAKFLDLLFQILFFFQKCMKKHMRLVTFPSGSILFVPNSSIWPFFGLDEMLILQVDGICFLPPEIFMELHSALKFPVFLSICVISKWFINSSFSLSFLHILLTVKKNCGLETGLCLVFILAKT